MDSGAGCGTDAAAVSWGRGCRADDEVGTLSKKHPLRYIFTDHALERMEQRGIEKDDVRNTVKYPTMELPADGVDRTWVRRVYRSRFLNVVYESRSRTAVIVTVYWSDC